MEKTLKPIKIGSRLKNWSIKSRSVKNWSVYKMQKNLSSKLLKRLKRLYLKGLFKNCIGQEILWRTMKLYFANKCNFSNKILIKKRLHRFYNRGLSEIFNEYFINIIKTLDLKPSIISTSTSLPKIIETFKDKII